MNTRIPLLTHIILMLFFGAFLASCSSAKSTDEGKETKQIIERKGSAAKTIKLKPHIHDSNPCTAALEHSHPNGDKQHIHQYDCENTNEFVSNAHIHPAANGYKRIRHVHPNGSNKHSHRR